MFEIFKQIGNMFSSEPSAKALAKEQFRQAMNVAAEINATYTDDLVERLLEPSKRDLSKGIVASVEIESAQDPLVSIDQLIEFNKHCV